VYLFYFFFVKEGSEIIYCIFYQFIPLMCMSVECVGHDLVSASMPYVFGRLSSTTDSEVVLLFLLIWPLYSSSRQ
jgi:hypothetical protein